MKAENKINIAKLLKDCPKGMELDCALFDNVILSRIDLDSECEYPIRIETKNGCLMDLTKYGTYTDEEEAKCVIFPKGKTTWEGFHRPFVEGDVIYTDNFVAILSHITKNGIVWYHCYYCINTEVFKAKRDFGIGSIKNNVFRFATEEEKQKLFDAIKANGYKWNAETKTLEKLIEPIFRVGDRVRHKTHIRQENAVTEIKDTHYVLDDELALPFINQDEYELVPNKFDIATLKPFESRVLVKNEKHHIWFPSFFGLYNKDSNAPFMCCNGFEYKYCVPFEGNHHLLGTTNDCDDFYKTWEK